MNKLHQLTKAAKQQTNSSINNKQAYSVCVCVRVFVSQKNKEREPNGGRGQRHKMAESQNGWHDLLEGDIMKCSV